MDLKAVALLPGLPETATEAEIQAQMNADKQAVTDQETLRAAREQKEKTEREAKIKAVPDKAIAGRRIKADSLGEREKMLSGSFETAGKILESPVPVEKLPDVIAVSMEGTETCRGKTFTQLQDKNPKLPAELEKENPEAFTELFNESFQD